MRGLSKEGWGEERWGVGGCHSECINSNEWGYNIKFVEQCYLTKGFWVFLIQKVSRMVNVFCSISRIYVWGRVEYNIIVCCATVRDRDDIVGLWCIAYSNPRAL